MGLNAYFTFAVVLGMGIPWEVALAAVFLEGIIFLVISIPQVGWRTKMINAIPKDLKIATGAGIGAFCYYWPEGNGMDPRRRGHIGQPGDHRGVRPQSRRPDRDDRTLAIAAMMARGMKSAIIGIVVASMYGWMFEVYDPYNDFAAGGAGGNGIRHRTRPQRDHRVCGPPGRPRCRDHRVGRHQRELGRLLLVMIAFLFVDIFDTGGTLYSVGRQAGTSMRMTRSTRARRLSCRTLLLP